MVVAKVRIYLVLCDDDDHLLQVPDEDEDDEDDDGDGGGVCRPTWDGWQCWEGWAQAGEEVERLCPAYIYFFTHGAHNGVGCQSKSKSKLTIIV